jgi:hypothetical protein
MKWQIGQATSLYLCAASGITGFEMVRSSRSLLSRSSDHFTMKHTVNQGLRIVRSSFSEQGRGTLTISLCNAPTNFRSYGIAQ